MFKMIPVFASVGLLAVVQPVHASECSWRYSFFTTDTEELISVALPSPPSTLEELTGSTTHELEIGNGDRIHRLRVPESFPIRATSQVQIKDRHQYYTPTGNGFAFYVQGADMSSLNIYHWSDDSPETLSRTRLLTLSDGQRFARPWSKGLAPFRSGEYWFVQNILPFETVAIEVNARPQSFPYQTFPGTIFSGVLMDTEWRTPIYSKHINKRGTEYSSELYFNGEILDLLPAWTDILPIAYHPETGEPRRGVAKITRVPTTANYSHWKYTIDSLLSVDAEELEIETSGLEFVDFEYDMINQRFLLFLIEGPTGTIETYAPTNPGLELAFETPPISDWSTRSIISSTKDQNKMIVHMSRAAAAGGSERQRLLLTRPDEVSEYHSQVLCESLQ